MSPAEIVAYIESDRKNGSVKLSPERAKIMTATAGALQADPKNRELYIQAMFAALSKASPPDQATADIAANLATAIDTKDTASALQIGALAVEAAQKEPLTDKQQTDIDALKAASTKGG